MSRPTVSVVIPCFNQGRFLAAALESVAGQTLPADDVIVVDDGSADETAAVARRYPWARYVAQANRGLASARNTGLGLARGDFLVFLDADDRLCPRALEIGMAELIAHPEVAFTYGRCQRVNEQGEPLPTPPTPVLSGDCYTEFLQSNPIWMPAVVMYRQMVCAPLMLFDCSVNASADYELYLRIARRFLIHGHPHVVAEYRLHDACMSRDAGLMLRSTMAVMRAQRSQLESRHKAAYRSGLRHWRWLYGEQLVEQATRYAHRPRQWMALLGATAVLVRHYPRGLLAHARRKLRRWLRPEDVQPRARPRSGYGDAR